jgi:hypothetical protein
MRCVVLTSMARGLRVTRVWLVCSVVSLYVYVLGGLCVSSD